jgi:hypothetical protein
MGANVNDSISITALEFEKRLGIRKTEITKNKMLQMS